MMTAVGLVMTTKRALSGVTMNESVEVDTLAMWCGIMGWSLY